MERLTVNRLGLQLCISGLYSFVIKCKKYLTLSLTHGKIIYVDDADSAPLRQIILYGGYGVVVNTADCGSVTRGFDPHYSPHNLHIIITVGVSPSGKATDFDSVMRWFDPSHPCQHDSLAQLAEHLTFNQGVPSSNLGWITTIHITWPLGQVV